MLETTSPSFGGVETWLIHGPFDGMEAAEKWIKKDVAECFAGMDEDVRSLMQPDEAMFLPRLIVRMTGSVIPMPFVQVTFKQGGAPVCEGRAA